MPIVQIDRFGHACQGSACQGHVLLSAFELVTYHIGVNQWTQGNRQLRRGKCFFCRVFFHVCPVKHVGLVHGTFPRVQFMERTPGHAACGGCGGFRSGHAIEHDIFRIIVVEQQLVRAFRHGNPSSFIGQVALHTLSVAGIDLDAYSVGRSRTQIFIVVLPVLFPQFFPVIGVSTFPFLFPVGREIHLHGKTMLVVVVTQVFPAARGKECQSCKRKPHEGIS